MKCWRRPQHRWCLQTLRYKREASHKEPQITGFHIPGWYRNTSIETDSRPMVSKGPPFQRLRYVFTWLAVRQDITEAGPVWQRSFIIFLRFIFNHVCVCLYVCVHVWVCMSVSMCVCVHMCVYTCVCACVCMYMCMWLYICVCASVCVYSLCYTLHPPLTELLSCTFSTMMDWNLLKLWAKLTFLPSSYSCSIVTAMLK